MCVHLFVRAVLFGAKLMGKSHIFFPFFFLAPLGRGGGNFGITIFAIPQLIGDFRTRCNHVILDNRRCPFFICQNNGDCRQIAKTITWVLSINANSWFFIFLRWNPCVSGKHKRPLYWSRTTGNQHILYLANGGSEVSTELGACKRSPIITTTSRQTMKPRKTHHTFYTSPIMHFYSVCKSASGSAETFFQMWYISSSLAYTSKGCTPVHVQVLPIHNAYTTSWIKTLSCLLRFSVRIRGR